MQGVLAGFAIIGIIIAIGFLLAQLRILDATAQGVLTRVSFYVASPALMITVLGGTDTHRLLSANLIASLGSVAVAATFAVLLARMLWKREAGDTVIAAVDPRWRHGATQGHSGTHMVHAALRQVLGPNAVQAGSLGAGIEIERRQPSRPFQKFAHPEDGMIACPEDALPAGDPVTADDLRAKVAPVMSAGSKSGVN